MCKDHIGPRWRQSGIYTFWVALIIPALAGALALSADIGFAMSEKLRSQHAADAGAIAGAMAMRREQAKLLSNDPNIKKSATDSVVAAARLGAEENGFKHDVDGVTVTVNMPPTVQQTNIYQNDSNYRFIGVTVSKPSPSFFARLFDINAIPVNAHAVAGHGIELANSALVGTCPGVYVYGNPAYPEGRNPFYVSELNSGSNITVIDGGIFMDFKSTSSSVVLKGSSNAFMKSQWEWVETSSFAQYAGSSVDYYCKECYIKNNCPQSSCVKPVSVTREIPNYNTGAGCTTANTNCCIDNHVMKCPCNTGTPVDLKTAGGLAAGRYCGLTIKNTGRKQSGNNWVDDEANKLILKPSQTTNVFDFRFDGTNYLNGGLRIVNSIVEGIGDAKYQGIVFFTDTNSLQLGSDVSNDKNRRATLQGIVRLYVNAFYFNNHSTEVPSRLNIKSFDEEGCGKLKVTTLVQ